MSTKMSNIFCYISTYECIHLIDAILQLTSCHSFTVFVGPIPLFNWFVSWIHNRLSSSFVYVFENVLVTICGCLSKNCNKYSFCWLLYFATRDLVLHMKDNSKILAFIQCISHNKSCIELRLGHNYECRCRPAALKNNHDSRGMIADQLRLGIADSRITYNHLYTKTTKSIRNIQVLAHAHILQSWIVTKIIYDNITL